MSERRFPILGANHCRSVPWDCVEPHRSQIEINHGQTLEGLAQRGGLDFSELACAMAGRKLHGDGFFAEKK